MTTKNVSTSETFTNISNTSFGEYGAGTSLMFISGSNDSVAVHGTNDRIIASNTTNMHIADHGHGTDLEIFGPVHGTMTVTSLGMDPTATMTLVGQSFTSGPDAAAHVTSDGHGGTILGGLVGGGSIHFVGFNATERGFLNAPSH